MTPTFQFRSTPKSGFVSDESTLDLTIAYESNLASLRKRFPADTFEEFELTDREPAKGVSIALGHQKNQAAVLLRAGTKPFFFHEALRKTVGESLLKAKAIHVNVSMLKDRDAELAANALGNLHTLQAWEPTKFGKKAKISKTPNKKPETILVSITGRAKPAAFGKAFEHGRAQARATNLVRTLAELPGNELTPKIYVEKARALAKSWGVTVEFLDQKALAKKGAGSFLAVSRSTPDGDQGILHLSYQPKGKSSGRRIAIVGKGLCFDTGGYNIKTGHHMYDMHRDMTGSAVALALTGLLIESGSRDEIHCYMALAENLISPTAYRPNDVVVAANGVSIEVVDTDAEGRMVLADTLAIACEKDPDMIIDFATLTGAVIRAIDTRRSGVFTNHDPLAKLALEAGEATGERVWHFPIGGDYLEGIHSEIADVRQCASGNNADHIYAASFLNHFVKPEIPWIHVDLAAESNKGGLGLIAKDITGFGVRLSEAIIQGFKPPKRKKK